MLIVLPLAGGQTIFLMRAESPGPAVSKMSPHMRDTATILYAIYFGLTVLQMILLLIGGMPFFDAICVSLGTAGTGGFGNWNDSIAHYNSAYLQNVITVFMILFGINFSAYFLILTRKFRQAFRIEEIRVYLGVIFVFAGLIAFNVRPMFGSLRESFHHALFQVASIITTTGFRLWISTSGRRSAAPCSCCCVHRRVRRFDRRQGIKWARASCCSERASRKR